MITNFLDICCWFAGISRKMPSSFSIEVWFIDSLQRSDFFSGHIISVDHEPIDQVSETLVWLGTSEAIHVTRTYQPWQINVHQMPLLYTTINSCVEPSIRCSIMIRKHYYLVYRNIVDCIIFLILCLDSNIHFYVNLE